MIPVGTDLPRDIEESIKSYLPKFYEEFREVNEIVKVDAKELELLNQSISSLLNQFSVDTATWGLSIWEKNVDVEVNPKGKTYEQRRSIVKSKLRGIGVATIDLIKSVAESFANGTVDVHEIYEEFKISIEFIDIKGRPNDLDGLTNAVKEILPAHLIVDFIFKFLSWSELTEANVTWKQVEPLTWSQLEVADFK